MPEVCPSGNFISLEELLEGRLRDISILNSSVTEIDRRDLTKQMGRTRVCIEKCAMNQVPKLQLYTLKVMFTRNGCTESCEKNMSIAAGREMLSADILVSEIMNDI